MANNLDEVQEIKEEVELVIVDIEYVAASSLKDLRKQVQKLIDKGWTPAETPVVIDMSSTEGRYIQTMFLEDYDDSEA